MWGKYAFHPLSIIFFPQHFIRPYFCQFLGVSQTGKYAPLRGKQLYSSEEGWVQNFTTRDNQKAYNVPRIIISGARGYSYPARKLRKAYREYLSAQK